MGGKRPPGHRQKGAGTVVVSRGDQVRQGLLVKEWQKTPMQLLQQFCQSKKRIQARYVHARCPEGRFRMRCVLPDDKSSAKDLAFCPEQDFPTMEDAKHAAALLALHNVEPSRPLERLLPEPYDKLWLALGTPTPAAAPATAGASNKKKDVKKKPATDETATTTDMDLWADAPPPTEKDAGKPKAKELPTQLTSDRKFASKAEQQLAQLERAQRRNDQQRKRENRERANPHKTVFMSAACRDLIEGVLTRLGVVGGDATAGRDEEEKPAEALGGDDDDEETRKQLEKLGFQPTHIDGALKACRRKQDDDDFLTVVLDWLCLHVPEGELPKGFNPEGTQLDVVVSSRAKPSSPLAAVLVQRLMKLGYDRLDAVVIVQDFVSRQSDAVDVQQDAPSDALVLQVVAMAMPHVLKYLSLDAHAALSSAPSDEELQQLREDELFALEAIYDDRMTRETLANGAERLVIQLSEEDVHLELLLPRESKYPFELPVVSVVATGDARHAPPQLLHAMVNAIQATHASLGEPLIYDLCVSVESSLSDTEKHPRIVLLPHPKATKPAALPVAVPSPAPGAQTKKPGRNDRQRRGSTPPTKRGPSREQLQQLSDKLLRLRQAKDARPEFQQMLRARSRLPAAAEKQHILEYLVHDQVVLVCGQTGCGKTTQIPQFILDDYIDSGRGGECNIICTQPRRIAAIGVATRVAQERCEEIADVVGYQIRMDAKKSANTRLLFCTTGVLLRRLLSDRTLAGISHVVVDEVHERNVDTDFLLSILRDLLPQRPDLRLILMSATMNAQLFLDYFSSSKRPCPVLDIPGFTFPVETMFLEDVLATTKYQVPKNLLRDKRKAAPQQPQDGDTAAPQPSPISMTPEQIVQRLDDSRIDFDLCAHLVQYLVEQRKDAEHAGAILVFLPGTGEIKRLLEMLSSPRVWVLPLHGALSGADQAQVFKAAPAGKTKIILATNIAETSITINDITTVIDCGRVKEMVYDPQLRRSQLLDCWASQAACDQRRGRAGRVQAGTCYRLFSKTRFAKMDAQLAAEIHRVSLAQLCLQIKKLELGSIRAFLSKAIEPPKPDAIDAAVHELLAIAALESVGGHQESEDEHVRLTPLGSHLAMLPLDARIGKFLIYGAILRCVEPVAVIAACISSKSPFNMVMNDPELRGAQEKLKAELGGGAKSDHLLLARLVMEKYAPLTGQKAKRSFCKQFALSYDALETIVDQKAQYLQQLDAIGFYDAAQREPLNANATVPRIVKAALCAGLYDNVIQVVYPDQKYFQAAHGVVTEDHDAKQIRYFVRSSAPPPPTHDTSRFGPWRDRVFMHPSSTNFTQTQYDSPWLLYTELVQTSKVFVRESTMVPPYALLLFGGRLEVLHEKNELCLDGWIRFQAVARIGVLVKAIRRKLDELLAQKIARPELDIAQSELVTAIGVLLKSEGM